ncbi:ABC transporter permease [Bacteroides sp. 519]|uniref:ABC transporter permease n=1 Tax=Bacteroides sp. 519 TaxID=2302937 RepID=UPI0013D7DA0A|nr:FtsX-like permease family protein [Bacteroides sp. 519]NDV59501.1 ABC transporter permease [Bacteroides sp. 519]
MKQQLKQIWNERRANGWLWAELLIVFVALWYVVDWGYTTCITYYEPVGFDITDTYRVTVYRKTDKADGYVSPENATQTGGQDMLDMVERLRHLPEVEAVALSNNATPYCGSNSGTGWRIDSTVVYPLRRLVTPDFFRVFRYQSTDGKGYEPLVEALKRGEAVASVNLMQFTPLADMSLLNSVFFNVDDSATIYRVGAVSEKVRYNDFWPNYNDQFVAWEIKEESIAEMNDASWYEISLRVHPGTTDFPARLMEISDAQFSIGNLFISKVESFKDVRRHSLADMTNTVKTRMWMMAFLLLNIFLGIIGTFWFRTQQRRSEIGLRMALGSTRSGLWKRLMNEGILLLLLAFIPAAIICINLSVLEVVNTWPHAFTVTRFIIGALITLALMALMIVLGIWYPAQQAMQIEPAEALRDE